MAGSGNLHENWQINSVADSQTVASAMRSLYGFGDEKQRQLLDDLTSKKAVLHTGGTDGTAETRLSGGVRHVYLSSEAASDWAKAGIALGHEAYRNGVYDGEAGQLAETMWAVAAHTDMMTRMMADPLYRSVMQELIGGNQNLQNDLIARTLGGEIFDRYVDEAYDSSADYWLIHKNGDITWDGHLNLYYEDDIYDDKGNLKTTRKTILQEENGKGTIRTVETPDEAVNYSQLQSLINNANGETVNIKGVEVKAERLKEIAKANKYIIDNSTYKNGQSTSYAAEALLSDGYMSYDEALKAEKNLLSRYLNGGGGPNLVEHWSARYVLNRNDEFSKIDWMNSNYVPHNQSVKDFRDKVNAGRITFPDNVELLGEGASVYHGAGCLKYLFKNEDFIGSSRELVLRFDSENGTYSLENRDAYLGTYNFGDGPLKLDHTALDVLPYWDWANSPDDLFGSKSQGINATPKLKRLHPKFQEALDTHNKLLLESKDYDSHLYWQSKNYMYMLH